MGHGAHMAGGGHTWRGLGAGALLLGACYCYCLLMCARLMLMLLAGLVPLVPC